MAQIMALPLPAPADLGPRYVATTRMPLPRRFRAVAIGDARSALLGGLRVLMASVADVAVVSSPDELRPTHSDLVLVLSGTEVPWHWVARLAAEDARVLIVTARWSDDDELRAVETGAIGYVSLDGARESSLRVLTAALDGECVFSRRVLGRHLKAGLEERRRWDDTLGLTPRQQQILSLLATGAADKEIAATLGIAVATVQKHVVKMRRRLGAANRAAAVWIALSAG